MVLLDPPQPVASFLAAYWILTCLHEAFHVGAACCVGQAGSALTASNLVSGLCSKHVKVEGVCGWRAAVIRHAGWVGSVLLAVVLNASATRFSALPAAAILTALDALCSDLLGITPAAPDTFLCGNFGLVLLKKDHRQKVLQILKEMVRITMMRGAQSGGVVTYVKNGSKGVKGMRSRVVNGKRTDLSELIVGKLTSDQRFAPLLDGPRIYAGHTRFATTSKATFDGTHPHQWTPPENFRVWRRSSSGGDWTCKVESVENFICHNGDLDAFEGACDCAISSGLICRCRPLHEPRSRFVTQNSIPLSDPPRVLSIPSHLSSIRIP